jgi:cytochrome b
MSRPGRPPDDATAAPPGATQRSTTENSGRLVRVWDLPTRLFHWLAVALVVAAYASWRLNWMDWHAWFGEALLALVLWRLIWGFFGSDTARFARFLASPRVALHHLAQIRQREIDREPGHNPAGGWMVLVLLALLLGETLTGIYVGNDVADQGPLTDLIPAPIANLITALHRLLWQALLAAVVLHLLAIFAYFAVKRHNLLLPMVTGRKRLPDSVPSPRMAGLARALAALLCAAAAAAALASLT